MSTDKQKRIQPQVRKHFKWAESPPPVNNQPTPKKAKGGPYQQIAERLRANPKRAGMWALVAHGTHYAVVSRLRKEYPDIDWTTRKNGDRQDLWASLKVVEEESDTADNHTPLSTISFDPLSGINPFTGF